MAAAGMVKRILSDMRRKRSNYDFWVDLQSKCRTSLSEGRDGHPEYAHLGPSITAALDLYDAGAAGSTSFARF